MTSPARYSAGTAFLDVIPSFRGVQRAMARELRGIEAALGRESGDQFGKNFEESATKAVDKALNTSKSKDAGKKSGDEFASGFQDQLRTSMARANRNLGAIKIDTELNDAKTRTQLKVLQKNIERLGKVKIGVDMDAGPAFIVAQRLEAKLRELQDASANIKARTDFGKAIAELEAFRKRVEKDANFNIHVDAEIEPKLGRFERTVKQQIAAALSNLPPARIDADTTLADRQIAFFRKRLFELSDKSIGIDIDGADMLREIETIRFALASLVKDENVKVDVKTNAAAAAADLLALRAVETLIDGTDVEIKVKVKDDKAVLSRLERFRQAAQGGADSETGANAFRSFNFAVLGITAGLAGMIPLLGAAAGGIALLAPIALGAAGGIGVLALSFMGIGSAVQALGKAQDNQAKDNLAYTKAMRTASRGVEDAQRGVASAARGQQSAERDLVRAQQDVIKAQEAVTQARVDAREELENLQLSLRGGALAERQAVFDLKDAQDAYNASLADPGATADERARLLLDLDKQKFGLDQVKESNADLAQEQAKWVKTGIEGSDGVRQAQDGVAQAQDGVRAALEGIADASRGMQDAQRNLTQAQEDYNTALYQTGDLGSSSMQAVEVAMGKLSPAGRHFALFINGLRDDFKALRDTAQAGILPGVESAMSAILVKNGPLLKQFIAGMSGAIGGLFTQLGDLLTSPQWQAIFATFSQYAPIFMTQFGQIGMALLTFFGELFKGLAPYAASFGDTLVQLAIATADWMTAFVQGDTFKALMEWLFTNGPIVFGVVWDIVRAIANLFVALEPLGMVILGLIDDFANWIAGMDPKTLGTIVTVILGLVVAFQLASGALAILTVAVGILEAPLALIIFAVVAVGIALVALYLHSEKARDIMNAVFRAIAAVVSWWWTKVVFPVIGWFVDAWNYLVDAFSGGGNTMSDIFKVIGDVASWLWNNILHPIFKGWLVIWGVLWKFIMEVWNGVGKIVFDAIISIVTTLWDSIIKPIFQLIGLAFKGLFLLFMFVWEHGGKQVFDAIITIVEFIWTHVFSPILSVIAARWKATWALFSLIWYSVGKPIFDFIGAILKTLVAVFTGNFDQIGKIWKGFWDSLKDAASRPINFVIKFVLNEGLFAAINWVIKTLHLPDDWHLKPLKQVGSKASQYAAGGRVAGWSPHDKADNIPAMLTAGEYVQPVDTTQHYGVEAMDLIRKKKIPREVFSYFAAGGYVDMVNAVKKRFPLARVTSTYRAGDPGYHGRGQAADFGGSVPYPGGNSVSQMLMIDHWIADTFKNITELIHTGAGSINLKNGALHNYSAAVQQEHLNHVHWAMDHSIFAGMKANASAPISATDWGAAFKAGLTGFGATSGIPGITSILDVYNKIKGGVSKVADMAGAFGHSPFVDMLTHIPSRLVARVWSGIKGAVGSALSGLLGGEDGLNANSPSFAGSAAVTAAVRKAATPYGWGSGTQWDALSRLIQKESSWNPNAQNPTSTAYGLFQFLNSTWASVGMQKTSDPFQQAFAGMKYIKSRYGMPSQALAFHNKNNWYGEGGEVGADASSDSGAPTLYDTGGWLPPGITTVLNATNKPEPILTGQQWEELTAEVNTTGGDRRLIEQLHLHEVHADMTQAVAAVNHLVRVYDNGGRYVGSDA